MGILPREAMRENEGNHTHHAPSTLLSRLVDSAHPITPTSGRSVGLQAQRQKTIYVLYRHMAAF